MISGPLSHAQALTHALLSEAPIRSRLDAAKLSEAPIRSRLDAATRTQLRSAHERSSDPLHTGNETREDPLQANPDGNRADPLRSTHDPSSTHSTNITPIHSNPAPIHSRAKLRSTPHRKRNKLRSTPSEFRPTLRSTPLRSTPIRIPTHSDPLRSKLRFSRRSR